MLSTACPKPSPRWRQKAERRATETRSMKQCFAACDARDGHHCRVCRRRVGGLAVDQRVHHHHLEYRSKGGQHTTDNVLCLCPACHQAVHDAVIRLAGNADLPRGVKLERYTEAGWKTERWV